MDSISHAAMGTGIAIIATNSGVIPPDYTTLTYITLITASMLPDIDVVTKLGGNKHYINMHRGFTHSLIMLFILSLISNIFMNIMLPSSMHNVYTGWILLAIAMHIFTDVFNNYGVKLLWPFVDRWLSVNASYTVDYVILGLHALGFILYFGLGLDGFIVFTLVLVFSILYLLVLGIRRQLRAQYIKSHINHTKSVVLTSKSTPHQWKFVALSKDNIYHIGELRGNKIIILETQSRQKRIDQELYNAIKHDNNFKIFKKFSKVFNWEINHRDPIIEVRLKDLSYYSKINKNYVYLFNCIIYLNSETLEIENTYVGFTTGEQSLYRMVEQPTNFKRIWKRILKRKGDIRN